MKNWTRKRKLALCLLLLLVSLSIIISMSDWPSPTPEIALRRMEKRYLLGPSQIITTMDFEYSPWDHLIIGKSDRGYTTYEYLDDLGWDNGNLRYFPGTDGATLFCTDYKYRTESGDPWLPIFLFPEKQGYGEVKMTLTITTPEASRTYQLDGERRDSSFYLFALPADDLEAEFFWLLQQALTGAYSEYVLTGTVEIEIEFLDISGSLVDTYTRAVTK